MQSTPLTALKCLRCEQNKRKKAENLKLMAARARCDRTQLQKLWQPAGHCPLLQGQSPVQPQAWQLPPARPHLPECKPASPSCTDCRAIRLCAHLDAVMIVWQDCVHHLAAMIVIRQQCVQHLAAVIVEWQDCVHHLAAVIVIQQGCFRRNCLWLLLCLSSLQIHSRRDTEHNVSADWTQLLMPEARTWVLSSFMPYPGSECAFLMETHPELQVKFCRAWTNFLENV